MIPVPLQDGMPLPLCEAQAIETRGEKALDFTRILLALAVVCAGLAGTTDTLRAPTAERLVLIFYLAFSAAIYFSHKGSDTVGKHNFPGIRTVASYAHWIDLIFYATLVALGNSVFCLGFFFAMLAAASRCDFASGLRFSFVAAFLFGLLVYLVPFSLTAIGVSKWLIGVSILLAAGYVIAEQTGREVLLRRQLTLLRDVTKLSNPRFGIDHTLGSLLNELRAFYHADTCLIVNHNRESAEFVVRRTSQSQPEQAERVELLAAPVAGLLLSPPPENAFVYHDAGFLRRTLRKTLTIFRVTDGVCPQTTEEDEKLMRSLAAALDAESFISVPMQAKIGGDGGRLYIASSRLAAFELSDAVFVMQVLGQLMPLIENIRLVDRLASSAAEEERRKIGRDLHDSVIQPYIGIKMGLQAVRQRVAQENTEAVAQVEHLERMIDAEINDLRSYMGVLDKQEKRTPNLLPAMRRFASKFSEATGITVDVRADNELLVNDRLAAEAFQIMSEGLSNVRRHTQARRASVDLHRRNGSLVLSIENDGAPSTIAFAPFTPRSISERARALGGQISIKHTGENSTLVEVAIPF